MNSTKRAATTSTYKGVYFHAQSGGWRAQIRINGKSKTLGNFKNEKEAAQKYNSTAVVLFGEFAKLNVIED